MWEICFIFYSDYVINKTQDPSWIWSLWYTAKPVVAMLLKQQDMSNKSYKASWRDAAPMRPGLDTQAFPQLGQRSDILFCFLNKLPFTHEYRRPPISKCCPKTFTDNRVGDKTSSLVGQWWISSILVGHLYTWIWLCPSLVQLLWQNARRMSNGQLLFRTLWQQAGK